MSILFHVSGHTPKTCILVHETCGCRADDTERMFLAKGLGVHYIIDEAAKVRTYNPHGDDVGHAGPSWNSKAIGIEIVNPYHPSLIHDKAKHYDMISTAWSWKPAGSKEGRVYVLPTLEQIGALDGLLGNIIKEEPGWDDSGLSWVETVNSGYWFTTWKQAAQGIVFAHTHVCTSRADGAFPLLAWYLGISGLYETRQAAYLAAVVMAQGKRQGDGSYPWVLAGQRKR